MVLSFTPKVFSRRKRMPKPPAGEPWVYVGRPSRWGNPFGPRPFFGAPQVEKVSGDAVTAFEVHVRANPAMVDAIRRELAGKHLVCWCAPARCHADVLLRVANGGEP